MADITGRLSTRSDVYSFGVVLLELLTGRRALDKNKAMVEQKLVDWARPYLGEKRKLFRIMDTRLEGQYPQKAVYAIAGLALQCLTSEAKARPRMSEVLRTLEQLDTSKNGLKISPPQRGVDVSPVRKLPARHLHSPQYLTPGESPLSSNRPSPRIS